jgi:Xaa-Pro aminopeptidase
MIKERVSKLRALFDEYQIDGYIIKTGDEYLSEYTADYAKRLQYITGFTGSNATTIILKETAYFFTDGRYLEQSKKELDPELFETWDLKLINSIKFTSGVIQLNPASFRQDEFKDEDAERTLVREHSRDQKNSLVSSLPDDAVGYDPKLFTTKSLNNFAHLKLRPVEDNLIDKIWPDRPDRPASKIYIYPDEFSGQNYLDKVESCRKSLEKYDAGYSFITRADSICWLLNIRASDIPFSPLLLGAVVIARDNIYLFTNSKRVNADLGITIESEEKLPEFLQAIEDKVLIDEENTNSYLAGLIRNKQNIQDPCILLKACKNETEIKGFIQGHIHDAVALCEFFTTIEETDLSALTEYDLSQQLTEIRAKQTLYIMDSFPTICGFKGNGSIIHYNPQKETAKKIIGDGLLLIDSGAHYMGATTDVTRVIAIGAPTNEQKDYYTKVLKGHIALARAIFPKNINGSNLDVLARQFLWETDADYAHGTGHGVGACLSVHEGPQSINLQNTVPLQKNMVLSNEPGFYKEGEYGIRIENLMYIDYASPKHRHPEFSRHPELVSGSNTQGILKQVQDDGYLRFKTLTLVPYEKKLINFDLLTALEIAYIKDYYNIIHESIRHLLSSAAQKWLEEQIKVD